MTPSPSRCSNEPNYRSINHSTQCQASTAIASCRMTIGDGIRWRDRPLGRLTKRLDAATHQTIAAAAKATAAHVLRLSVRSRKDEPYHKQWTVGWVFGGTGILAALARRRPLRFCPGQIRSIRHYTRTAVSGSWTFRISTSQPSSAVSGYSIIRINAFFSAIANCKC